MSDCLFCKIAAGDIPSTAVHETEDFYCFRDLDPQAPTHVLVIPRKHYANAGEIAADDPLLAGGLLAAAREVAQLENIAESGYRLIFNTGDDGQQSVHHVHCHVLGGRQLNWPPG